MNENDACNDTIAGTTVGPDGCPLDTNPPGDNSNNGGENVTDPVDNTTDPSDSTDNLTDIVDDGPGDESSTDSSDNAESESGLFGISYTTLGLIAAVIVVLLLTLVVVRGRNSKGDTFAMQEKAYADAGYAAVTGIQTGAADSTITPEQLAYEQQLVAAGYPADYARAYADQHFRPWLQQ